MSVATVSHLHLDVVGGIAGDMFIASMLDAFKELQPDVMQALACVLPAHAGKPKLYKGLNSGISGLRFELTTDIPAQSEPKPHGAEVNVAYLRSAQLEKAHTHEHCHDHSHENTHAHTHAHGHDHHHHEHSHENSHEHAHTHTHVHAHDHQHHEHSHENNGHTHHEHTTYRYLCELLLASPLSKTVCHIAIDILTIIAVAEAKIHGKTLDDVHFHELADWDSLMDVVASAVILDHFSNTTWSLSKLPMGGGLVQTQHGLIPVPAPATAEILKGFEFIDDGIKGERITPTGAAILRYIKNIQAQQVEPCGELSTTGYGLGTKTLPNMPNMLRVLVFKQPEQKAQHETVVNIQLDVDDMTGEELGLAVDNLRQVGGVIDVTSITARGKKNRPVEILTLLATTQAYKNVIEQCFIQTSTIGLRWRIENRQCLPREYVCENDTRFKVVTRPNNQTTTKIEHDELTYISSLAERRAKKYKIESEL